MTQPYIRPDSHRSVGPIWFAWGRTRTRHTIIETRTGTFKIHTLIYKTRTASTNRWHVTTTIRPMVDPTQHDTIFTTGASRRRALSNAHIKLHAFLP